MKTPKQIRHWMQQQEWFESFKEQTIEYYKKQSLPEVAEKILNGESGSKTISGAFPWICSREGHSYWESKDQKFMTWYVTRTKMDNLKRIFKTAELMLLILFIACAGIAILSIIPDWAQWFVFGICIAVLAKTIYKSIS